MLVHLITKSGAKLDMQVSDPSVNIEVEILKIMAIHQAAADAGQDDELVNDPIVGYEVVGE